MRAHPHDVANEPARQVDHVRAEVAENAIGPPAVEAPIVLPIAPVVADVVQATMVWPPNPSPIDQRMHMAQIGQPTPGEKGHMVNASSFGTLIHRTRIGSAAR